MLPRSTDICDGDVIISLPSSGVHSNGFSLVRRVVAKAGLAYTAPCPFPVPSDIAGGKKCQSLGEGLLVPTRIYVQALLPLMRSGLIKAFAHITGGGLTENICRVINDGHTAVVDAATWTPPGVFRWLASVGGMFSRSCSSVCVVPSYCNVVP
eukprot:m.734044 g.734044  ORF g.734044 m.734044 type:complete len:153 (+) comp23078_c0_seq1:80-538(+)